ncbi:YitT family protein [Paenibacillus sp. UNC499MF]|uniref:YczE/YyaS/YitT family protein n=1 Tax=Paenibacillus sp. UNC499MF TaxID=1502751 RepID=UPI0008A02605|nr:DUF6198 family protein [Paenibacillus sp. UNC499MF]SEG24250.1 Uncharacterized membrane protein YczE [Paenibacillus sp. UNC499MF]
MQPTNTAPAELQGNSLTRRWILYLIGIYILTLGVSLAIRAGIGISPQSSLTRVMTVIQPNLSQGTYNFILELFMLLLTYLVLPKDFKLKNFASLIPALALAFFLDFNLQLTSFIKLDVYYTKLMLLVFGDAALALGLFMMIQANLVLMPIDMFVNTVFKRTGKKWGNIKTVFDCSLLLLAACIGLIFLHKIMFIREGTILNAILVGQYIKLYTYLFNRSRAKKGLAPKIVKH